MRLIFNDKKFAPMFWTQFLGAFNDNVFKNALVTYITFKEIQIIGLGSAEIVALAGGLFILPFFLFSGIAGQICDKYEQAHLIRLIKLWELIVMALAAFGFYFSQWGMLLGVLFLMGAQSTFFGPIKYSILPQLVASKQLVKANALVEMGTFLAILIGTILGVLTTTFPNGEMIIIGLLLGVSAFGYFSSLFVPVVSRGQSDLKLSFNPIQTTFSILKIVKKKRAVFNSTLAISWFWFVGAGLLTLFPAYSKSYLNGSEFIMMILLSIFTLGIAIGSIICEKLSHGQVELGLVPIGSIGMTLFMVDLGFIDLSFFQSHPMGHSIIEAITLFPPFIHIIIDLSFIAFFGGLFIVPLYTLLQERSDPSERSRVIAANNILNALFMVVCAVLIMVATSMGVKIPQIYIALGVINLLVAIYIYTVVPEFTLRFYSWVLSNTIYKIKKYNGQNIPKEGAAILICNHVSFVDWLVLAAVCPRPLRFVMWYKFMSLPFVGWIFRHARVIPIAGEKENPKIKKQAFETIQKELRDGEIICIFPEGSITHDGLLAPFKKGIEYMLRENPVPVIPMALKGLWGSRFSRCKDPKMRLPAKLGNLIEVKIGEAIAPEAAKAEYLQKVVQQLIDE